MIALQLWEAQDPDSPPELNMLNESPHFLEGDGV
jgi:hypothetical protein